MELTQKQIDKLKERGFDSAKISSMAKKFGYDLPVAKKGILQKATDVVTSVFPGKKVGEAIGTLGGLGLTAGKEAIGLAPKGATSAYDISAPTPMQIGGDIIKGATMVAGASLPVAGSVVGKAAQFGALGAVGGGAEAVTQGESAGGVAKKAVIGGAVGGVVGASFGLAEKGIKGLANLFGKAGDKIQTTIIKPSAKDIKDGFSLETIKKYNLGGSLKQTFEKTDATLDDLSKKLNQKLSLAGKKPILDLNKVYENTTKRLLGNKLESFGANTQMEGAIDRLRGEISAVVGKNGLTSIPEAQVIKRAAGHFGAWSYGVPTPEATASQKVYDTFYNELKVAIEKASPQGVKEINQQISKLIPVMNALIRRIPVAERNSALSLTDIITLSAATLEPRALSLSLLNLASKSGRVGSALSKLPKVGEATAKTIQKVEPVARTMVGR